MLKQFSLPTLLAIGLSIAVFPVPSASAQTTTDTPAATQDTPAVASPATVPSTPPPVPTTALMPPPPPYYAPPAYPPQYYAPAPYSPRYGAPPAARPLQTTQTQPNRAVSHVRHVSLGVSGTLLALNQNIGLDDVVLGGLAVDLRFRTSGHFALDLRQGALFGSFWGGTVERSSFPLTVSLMGYLFSNRDDRHFNLFALGGGGVVWDHLDLADPNGFTVAQDFFQWQWHAGGGAELRFRWLSVDADVRAVGLYREDRLGSAVYYAGVTGGPIPKSSYGVETNLRLGIWF